MIFILRYFNIFYLIEVTSVKNYFKMVINNLKKQPVSCE